MIIRLLLIIPNLNQNEALMNKDIIQGHWTEAKGKIRQQWGKLTDDDVSKMKGTYEELTGKLQSSYGYQKDQAKKEVDAFIEKHNWKDQD